MENRKIKFFIVHWIKVIRPWKKSIRSNKKSVKLGFMQICRMGNQLNYNVYRLFVKYNILKLKSKLN